MFSIGHKPFGAIINPRLGNMGALHLSVLSVAGAWTPVFLRPYFLATAGVKRPLPMGLITLPHKNKITGTNPALLNPKDSRGLLYSWGYSTRTVIITIILIYGCDV